MKWPVIAAILGLCLISTSIGQRTSLDSIVPAFRIFKTFATGLLDRDSKSQSHQRSLQVNEKLQKYIEDPFPCNIDNSRSPKRPISVHKLRPGDIDVIGAIGDSLTAGFGLTAVNVQDIFLENRGKSFSIGGEKTWREFLTIPNILKEFNPNLVGYSLKASTTIDRASQFNVAEGGSVSAEMPYMTKVLVKRIMKDPRVNLKEDWKMITFCIGANDFCSDICFHEDLEKVLENHKSDMLKVLRTIRDNLPRTIVNVIPPPHLRMLNQIRNKPFICALMHEVSCPCFYGEVYKSKQEYFSKIMIRWQKLDEEITNLPEFDLEDFTVVFQPFFANYTLPMAQDGNVDYSTLSADCFHFSQKGNARLANSLWNNYLEPVGSKSADGTDIMARLECPSEDRPYIFTKRNSLD